MTPDIANTKVFERQPDRKLTKQRFRQQWHQALREGEHVQESRIVVIVLCNTPARSGRTVALSSMFCSTRRTQSLLARSFVCCKCLRWSLLKSANMSENTCCARCDSDCEHNTVRQAGSAHGPGSIALALECPAPQIPERLRTLPSPHHPYRCNHSKPSKANHRA